MSQQDVERDVDPIDGQAPVPAEPGHSVLPPAPDTGDAQVGAAIASLAGVAELPASEQVAVFEAVHGALTDRLADVEG